MFTGLHLSALAFDHGHKTALTSLQAYTGEEGNVWSERLIGDEADKDEASRRRLSTWQLPLDDLCWSQAPSHNWRVVDTPSFTKRLSPGYTDAGCDEP